MSLPHFHDMNYTAMTSNIFIVQEIFDVITVAMVVYKYIYMVLTTNHDYTYQVLQVISIVIFLSLI